MVYLNDNESIIESIYLNRSLTSNFDRSKTIINPSASVGIVFRDKSIIINSREYEDYEYLRRLSLYNDVKIRFKSNHPYISTFRRYSYRADRILNMRDMFIHAPTLTYNYEGVNSLRFIAGYGKNSVKLVLPNLDDKLMESYDKIELRNILDAEDLILFLMKEYYNNY